MLDVGFSEILLTSAIALIVLGPEKLPKVARQVGNWVGRARAMARQLSEQLEREVSAEELMRQTKSTGPSKTEHAAAGRDVTSGKRTAGCLLAGKRGERPGRGLASQSARQSSQ
jgi:sec-independent protein translocase protein TatB